MDIVVALAIRTRFMLIVNINIMQSTSTPNEGALQQPEASTSVGAGRALSSSQTQDEEGHWGQGDAGDHLAKSHQSDASPSAFQFSESLDNWFVLAEEFQGSCARANQGMQLNAGQIANKVSDAPSPLPPNWMQPWLNTIGIVSLMMIWGGILGVILGVYLVTAEAWVDEPRSASSIATLLACGALMVATGLPAFLMSRRGDLIWAIYALVASICIQAAGAGIMGGLDLPFLFESAIGVLGLQLLPGLLVLMGYFIFSWYQSTIDHSQAEVDQARERQDRLRQERLQEMEQQAAMRRASHVDHRSAKIIARALRRRRAIVRRRRQQQTKDWEDAWVLRFVMVTTLYLVVGFMTAFSFYICCLYGILFTPEQSKAWIVSSVVSFAIDIFIQEPVLHFAKVLVRFFWKLADDSARAIVVASVAARAGVVDQSQIAETINGMDDSAGGSSSQGSSKTKTRKPVRVADLISHNV